MFWMRVAGLTVEVSHVYDTVREFCEDFEVTPGAGEIPDIRLEITEEEIEEAVRKSLCPISAEEAEVTCVSKALAKRLPAFDALFLHAAVFRIDGRAIAIAANSGTGKSTLLSNCVKLLGPKLTVINGDKPIIRVTGDGVRAFSSPWRGKECWGENIDAPLRSLVLLSRGEEDILERREAFESLGEVVQHLYVPEEGYADPEKFLQVLECLLSWTDVYRFSCRNSPEAAAVLLEGLLGETFRAG